LQRYATPEAAPTPAGEAPDGGRLKAAAAIAAGSTMADAAKAACVDRTTLWRWMRTDADFVALVNQERADQAKSIRVELRTLAADAVGTLRTMMADPMVPAAVRLKVAVAALGAAGGMTTEAAGPTDPKDVEAGWKNEEWLKMITGPGC
jgi:ABC-type glycerol-3-phosphate transport system substrate-binding protein